jgi:hypothetical protein
VPPDTVSGDEPPGLDGDELEYTSSGATGKPVVIDGVTYSSLTAAAMATGIDRRTIGRRLASGDYMYGEEG